MKKLFILGVAVLSLSLSACNGVPVEDGNTNVESAESTEVTFSQQDFCLYSEPDETGANALVAWLGMTEDKQQGELYEEYYPAFGGESGIQSAEGTDSQGNTVSVVNFLNFIGGTDKCVETVKGIRTYGFEHRDEDIISTAKDVIANYGLDPQKENIYSDYTDDDNCTISMYFSIDKDKNVTRVISPLDKDISDIADVEAEYFIRFPIVNGYVCGVQMYRSNRPQG